MFAWILAPIDMLVLNPVRTVYATEWKMNFHRLTDSFAQLLLKALKSMFSNVEPLILFRVSHIHHVILMANSQPFLKKSKTPVL